MKQTDDELRAGIELAKEVKKAEARKNMLISSDQLIFDSSLFKTFAASNDPQTAIALREELLSLRDEIKHFRWCVKHRRSAIICQGEDCDA